MSNALLRARGLGRQFETAGGTIAALRTVDLDVDHGEMVAVMGPSGSGKSTLLLILALLLTPDRGSYRMLGQDMLGLTRAAQAARRRRWIGVVFQDSFMVETLSVYENLELPLIYAEAPRRERSDLICAALERVRMTHRLHHPASQLSGGERQRAGIARALVNRPQLILADEPTGQLDRDNGQRVMDDFGQVCRDTGTAILLATHDRLVAERCDRVLQLQDGVLDQGVPHGRT